MRMIDPLTSLRTMEAGFINYDWAGIQKTVNEWLDWKLYDVYSSGITTIALFQRKVNERIAKQALEAAFKGGLYHEGKHISFLMWPDVQQMVINASDELYNAIFERILAKENAEERAKEYVRFLGELSVLGAVYRAFDQLDWLPGMKIYSEVINSFRWNLGIQWLTWVIVGAPLRAAIGDPLERIYRKKYRTSYPTRADFEEMMRRRIIKEDEFKEQMKELGYPDEFLDQLKEIGYKTLSLETIKKAYKMKLIDKDELAHYLMRLGYTLKDTEILYDMIRRESTEEHKEITLSIAREAYREDIISKAEFEGILKSLGYDETSRRIIIRLEDARKARKRADLTRGALERAFREGVITEKEFRKRLIDLGFTEESANIIVETAKASMKPDFRKPTRALLENAFKLGVISEADFLEKLQEIGYDRETAELIVNTVKKQIEKSLEIKPRKMSVSQVLDAYFEGVIDLRTALDKLKLLGYSEEDATTLIKTEEKKRAPRPKKASLGALREAFRYGIITEHEFLAKLRELGYSYDEARMIVETEKKKITFSKKRASSAQLLRAFREGVIDEAELRQRLYDLGYVQEDIDLLVNMAKVSLEIPKKTLTHTEVLRAFREGIIDEDECAYRLMQMGYPVEDIVILMTMYRPA